MSDADALFAQPPVKPENPTFRETAYSILAYEVQRFGHWPGVCFSLGLVVMPILLLSVGAYRGFDFWGGIALTLVCLGAAALAPYLFTWPLDVLDARLKQRAALRAYAKDFAEWNAGAPARAVARRRHHGLVMLNGLVSAYHEKGAARAAAVLERQKRRAALEAKVGQMFVEYRLRNDWDASDPTLVPRLQAAFRKWMRDTPPFPPEDMALLATSADPATRALLPPRLTTPT